MSTLEKDTPSGVGCRRPAHLRRALSENNNSNKLLYNDATRCAAKPDRLTRGHSLTLCGSCIAQASQNKDRNRDVFSKSTFPEFCARVVPSADSSNTRASASSLEDDVFGGRGRGSQTSVANVKSREDLVMSDNGEADSYSVKQETCVCDSKLAVESGKTVLKSVQKHGKTRKRRAEKADKTSSSKVTAQIDSPVTNKLKNKHMTPTGSGAPEAVNWPMWNTSRSSRTRLNESCSDHEELSEQPGAGTLDDSSWQFISILPFRRGQRDDSKYRQLSAADSSASSDAEAEIGSEAMRSARNRHDVSQSSNSKSIATSADTTHNSGSFGNARSTDQRSHGSPATVNSAIQKPIIASSIEIASITVAEQSSDQQQVAGGLSAEDRTGQAAATTESSEMPVPLNAAVGEARPDASSRPLLFDQDDSDESNENDADVSAECVDLPPLDEADCAIDFLLNDHARSGVTEEDAISCAKLRYYATLGGVRNSSTPLPLDASPSNSLLRRQVLYALDPRETSDEDQPRMAAVLTPPPPPPRRTLPASPAAATPAVANVCTKIPPPTSGVKRKVESHHRASSGGCVQSGPSHPLYGVRERGGTGRNTPVDGISVLLPPPPAVAPRRSSATCKPSAPATVRQDWYARFDDDDDSRTQPAMNMVPFAASRSAAVGSASAGGLAKSSNPYQPSRSAEMNTPAGFTAPCEADTADGNEQTSMFVSDVRRFSGGVNALLDGTSSLAYMSSANKSHKRSSTGYDQKSSVYESSLRSVFTVAGQNTDNTANAFVCPPQPETKIAFSNLSFVDCTSDFGSRSRRLDKELSQRTVVARAEEACGSAIAAHRPTTTVEDAVKVAPVPASKELAQASRHDKDASSGRRSNLLPSFLRKSHASGSSTSSQSSNNSRNAITKENDDVPEPHSPASFQHRRFPSVSSSCSSQDSDDKRQAQTQTQEDGSVSSSGKRHSSSGLLASLSSFTFPRSLRRGGAKKSAAQALPTATAVASDVRG